MRNILTVFIMLLSLCLLSSCNEQDEAVDGGVNSPKNAIITLDINYTNPTIVDTKSRATSDCNVFFYCDRLLFARQLYGSYGTTISDALPQGNYDIYTIVGYGSDIGPKTKAELEALTTSANSQSNIENCEIYTSKTTYTITTNATINIGVTRMLSKVDFNITVDPAFATTFTLEYMELVNVNNTVNLYSDSKLVSGGVNFNKEPISGSSVTRSFTMFENIQGTNSSITDQRHKTSANAPSDKCTHLHIRGYNSGAKIDYYIYLGANNTSDFNLIRNHHYIINTTIYGVNDIDNRVSVIDASISEFEKSMYELPEPAKAALFLKSVRQNTPIDLTYTIFNGNGLLTVDGTTVQPNAPHRLTTTDINHTFSLLFGQLQDGNVKLGITVSDGNGYSLYKEIATTYESTKPLNVVATGSIPIKILAESNITLDISEENYTGDFTIKYEVISGNLITSHNSTNLSSGQSITGKAGSYEFACSPTALGAAKIKFTVTDTKGQSIEIIKEQLVRTVINCQYSITGENPILRSMQVALDNNHNYMESGFIFYFNFSEVLPCDITVNNIFVEFMIKDVGNPHSYNSNLLKLKPMTLIKGQKSYIVSQTIDYDNPLCPLLRGTMTNCSTPYSYDGRALLNTLRLITDKNTGNFDGELDLVKVEIESAAAESTDNTYYFEFIRKK